VPLGPTRLKRTALDGPYPSIGLAGGSNFLAFDKSSSSTELVHLGGHCYALAGFAYLSPWSVNAGFVCGNRRSLIVDTGPSVYAAATILGYAQAVRPGNTILAVNTELHLDHLAGNSLLLGRGIDVYGHSSVQRRDSDLEADIVAYRASVIDPDRRDEAHLPFLGTRITNPNRVVDCDQPIDLGGVTVELLLVPGHTTANLAVWVAEDRVLYAGDTVVSDYRPNLASGAPSDWRWWLQSLDRLGSLRAEILVPGHGRILRGGEISQEIVRVRRRLLEALGEA
jgi:cyclase